MAEESKETGVPSHLVLTDHFRVTAMVVIISLSSLGLFGYGGYLLDQYFNTGHLLFILLILISFPTAQYLLYKWITENYLRSVKKKIS